MPDSASAAALGRWHAWRGPLFWKMLGADALLVGFTAIVFPGSTGERLVVMIVALIVASLVINLILTPTALRPLRGRHPVPDPGPVASAAAARNPGEEISPNALQQAYDELTEQVGEDRPRTLRLVRECLRVHEEQRSQIAKRLRDDTAHGLAALSLELAVAIRGTKDPAVAGVLDVVQSATARMAEEVRAAADEIYPGLLAECGLLSALGALRRRVVGRTQLEVQIRVNGTPFAVPLALMRALLRVAEEAVENAERHAGAQSVDVTLDFDAPTVELEIRDDGLGFDVPAAERRASGVGLFRARELLAHAGGEMRIHSSPGAGTRIIARSTALQGSPT